MTRIGPVKVAGFGDMDIATATLLEQAGELVIGGRRYLCSDIDWTAENFGGAIKPAKRTPEES